MQIQRLTPPVGYSMKKEIGWLQLVEECCINSHGDTSLLLSDLARTTCQCKLHSSVCSSVCLGECLREVAGQLSFPVRSFFRPSAKSILCLIKCSVVQTDGH